MAGLMAQRLREIEDHNIAFRLQEEEFMRTESDEEMALRLQREFEEEELRQREDQARRDAELAQRLALLEEVQIPSTSELTTLPPQPQLHSALTTAGQGDPPLVDFDPPKAALNNLPTLASEAIHDPRTALQPEPHCNPFMNLLDDSPQGSVLLGALHPTNPFLQDIEGEGAEPLRLPPPPPYFQFVLPLTCTFEKSYSSCG
ncbi:unnamed protein product [Heligmosomoides polygyrus]|uniref:CCDC50_N domain-containing protein n=1 Tax=Heligmosomoides polygyrus TaxID=6339 RepID=A0A183GQX9_HELPZ|nr:unnamed protein product [Heligmosomoides polygyrus]